MLWTNKHRASQKGFDTSTWIGQITNHRTIHALVLFLVLTYYDHHCSYRLVIISADAHYCNCLKFLQKKVWNVTVSSSPALPPTHCSEQIVPKPTINGSWSNQQRPLASLKNDQKLKTTERVRQINGLWGVIVDKLDFISTSPFFGNRLKLYQLIKTLNMRHRIS